MEVDREREFWDSQADDLAKLKLAIWAEPDDEEAWERDLLPCLELIEPHLDLKAGDRVLDLGCGLGRLTVPLARMHPECQFIGVDISPEIIDRAWEVNDLIHNLDFKVGDGRTLPDIGEINAAYTMITFQHIPLQAVQGYINNIADHLVSGGRFRFQFCVGEVDAWLQHDAAPSSMENFCQQAGLTVTDQGPGGNPVWWWVTAVKS